MKKRSLLVAAVLPAALLATVGRAQDGAPSAPRSAQRGLVRVSPSVLEDEAPNEQDSSTFDAAQWRQRLTNTDLEQRMQHFDELLRSGWSDPRVIEFLEGLRDDAASPELAWTARLGLRQLQAARLFFHPRARLQTLLEPFESPVDEFFGFQYPQLRTFAMPPGGWPSPHGGPQGGMWENRSETRRMSVENTPDGWKVVITETVDGDEVTREYAGESLEEILRANPELKGDLQGSPLGGRPQGFRMEMRLPDGRALQLDELFRGFEGLEGFQPSEGFEWRPHAGTTPRKMRFFFEPQGKSQPVRTDVLGVRVGLISEEHAAELSLEGQGGLYVSSVLPGTIAHILGLGSGDVLLALNGRALHSAQDITDAMATALEADGQLELTWIDGLGEHRTKAWTPPEAQPAEAPQPKEF